MQFKNCTLAYVKDLYMKKVDAEKNSNQEKINELKAHYPELFDAKFLMDLLKNEFQRVQKGLDNNIIFELFLFKYH